MSNVVLDDLTLDFIRQHLSPSTNVRKLALEKNQSPGVDMKFALQQIAGWQIALRKVPTWAKTEGILYPVQLSMEQCSSEQTARYKAELIASLGPNSQDSTLVDLTGGLGVDFSFMASEFLKAIYVEQQITLCDQARHNFPLLGLKHAIVVQSDAVKFLAEMEPVDWIYIDPVRRDENGRKIVRISDCQPDVGALQEIMKQKAKRILVKFSPMLDVAQILRELPGIVEEIHIVAVFGECKEVLLVLNGSLGKEFRLRVQSIHYATNGEVQKFSFYRDEETDSHCEYACRPHSYLYEPHPALLKAGAFRLIAERFGVKKMNSDAHLYTSDEFHADFPGRRFTVQGFSGFSKKELKKVRGGIKQAHLTVRGFPASVDELRKRLSIKEGGEEYLFATTNAEGRKILIQCSKLS